MGVKQISTDRLLLVPFTFEIATSVLENNYNELTDKGFNLASGWPDDDAIETLPKIIKNLELVGRQPSGFESWLIIRKDRMMIIGDAGFKGRPNAEGKVDLGYAIIEGEREKGYGTEAAKALADWACSQPEVKSITAKCLVTNSGSAKVLRKIGFAEVSRDEEMISWSLDRR
ncbi:GNAT family N-acetyltransferase [Gorillibacterium massiliense]|uniref:GNAT family N-acetyltransferase n=1 Tax=Gorillibacterium massiliense TaxID=1280390 RepID=UPI00059285EF|nr:GNAT family N-acetyltransferase [Gorillibacterium massiliense]